MVAVSDRREGLVVDAGEERASVVGGGNKELAGRQAFGHSSVTLVPPNHATTESGFYPV